MLGPEASHFARTQQPRSERRGRGGLGDDAVLDRADALDLDPYDVAFVQIAALRAADARRRPGRDDQARLEREHGRERLDAAIAVEEKLIRVRVLALLAVHPGAQLELVRIRDLVRGDEPRPERTVGVERLSERP